jgi:hypothetical protein
VDGGYEGRARPNGQGLSHPLEPIIEDRAKIDLPFLFRTRDYFQ